MNRVDGPVVEVAAVCRRGSQLLLVRVGHGPAGGDWRLPGGAVQTSSTLAEAIAAHVRDQAGIDALCGPFLGWREHLDGATHRLRMYFEAVDMGRPVVGPHEPLGVAEAEWVEGGDVVERRLEAGLAEFLGETGLIDVVV